MVAKRIVSSPVNLGLYLDRSTLHIPDGGMSDCENVRIRHGKVRNDAMGWTAIEDFYDDFTSGVLTATDILHIDSFQDSIGNEYIMYVTEADVIRWDGTDYRYINTYDIEFGAQDPTPGNEDRFIASGIDLVAVVGDWIYIADDDPQPQMQFLGTYADDWYRITSVVPDGANDYVVVDRDITWTTNAFATIKHQMPFSITDTFDSTTFLLDLSAEDHWILVSGTANSLYSWNITTDVTTERDTLNCATVTTSSNQVLYGNYDDGGTLRPTFVKTSSIGSPFAFGSGTSLVATDKSGEILRLIPLQDGVIVYCEDSIHTMNFVGGNVIWTRRATIPDRGLYAANGVLDRGSYHEFIGRDGMFRFDGVVDIRVNQHCFDVLVPLIDEARKFRLSVAYDEGFSEALWLLPFTTDTTGADGPATTTYVVHEAEQMGSKPLPITKKTFDPTKPPTVFHYNHYSRGFIFGTENGVVNDLDGTDSHGGISVDCFARFGRRPAIDGNMKGIIHRLEAFMGNQGDILDTVTLKLMLGDYAEEDDGDMGSFSVVRGLDQSRQRSRHVAPRAAARYYEVKLETFADEMIWDVSGYAVHISQAGER